MDSAQQEPAISTERLKETSEEPHTYVYEPAGIQEQTGYIPMWLKLVAIGLIVWSIYYTIRFWSSD